MSILSRDTATGSVSYVSCLTQDATSPECGAARALDYADAVEVDERGQNVYVAGGYSSAIAVFERAPDGSLRAGAAGARPHLGRRLPQLAWAQMGRGHAT